MTRRDEDDSEANVAVVSRKTKSAEVERSMELSGWETLHDEPPRPVTALLTASNATAVVAVPTASKPSSRAGRKTPKAAMATDPSIDGWGDFDTDRLLREARATEETVPDDHDDNPGLAQDSDAALRRENRLEALAKHTGKPPPPREPAKHVVLRQRTLAVMELAPPEGLPPDVMYSKSAFKKPLITHRRRQDEDHLDDSSSSSARLPKIKRGLGGPIETVVLLPQSVTGLFGPHIEDSLATRAVIFQRFLPVWSLMSSRACDTNASTNADHSSSPTRNCNSASEVVSRDCKSPFECSMVLMKLCKAIGISLSASPPPEVWSTLKRRSSSTSTIHTKAGGTHADVDLDSFCEFVVRNALEPAMHHFRLDRDIGEYLHTIDAVVHGLVTRSEMLEMAPTTANAIPPLSQWRLRELSELQAVLPVWKKGIHFVQKQAPLVKAKPAACSVSSTLADPGVHASTHGKEVDPLASIQSRGGDVTVIQATDLSASYANKKLPAHEARAMQDANLRRKLQLRNSWQPRIVVADPLPLVNLDKVADLHRSPPSLLGSCIRVEAMVAAPPKSFATPGNSTSTTHMDNQIAEPVSLAQGSKEDEAPANRLLLCGSCAAEKEATLWCSACFAVYCSACWTQTHSSTVDTSCVNNQQELTLSAPSARPLRTHRDRQGVVPPVAIVYLPTKPIAHGKVLKGRSSHRPNQLDDPACESSDDEEPSDEAQGLAHAMSSHAILPAIKPPRQQPYKTVTGHHRSAPALDAAAAPSAPSASAMDSTANLLKALMLGTASSASVLGSHASSTNTASPWSSSSDNSSKQPGTNVPRVFKDPTTRRQKLRPTAITLDAAALYPP